MNFFIPALLFCLTVPISFILLVIIYIQFALAIKSKKEVPNWIYMFGQSFKRRTTTKYDDITNYAAFKQANSFILLLILSNIVFVITEYIKSTNLLQAVYNDIQSQFMVVIVSMILHGIFTSIIMFFRKSDETFRIYSSTQAVIGGFFYFAFFLTLSVSLVGCSSGDGLNRSAKDGKENEVEKAAIKLVKATKTGDYNLISADELKKSIDNKEDMILINTIPSDRFEKTKIKGAVNAGLPKEMKDLKPEEKEAF